jgi:hypothetical protein
MMSINVFLFYDSCFVNSMSIYSCKVLEYRKAETNRMESLKGYLTDELQALNVDTVRKDIPVSSSVRVSTLRA